MRVILSFRTALKLSAIILPPLSRRSSIAKFSTSLGAPKITRSRAPLILHPKAMASSICTMKPVVQVKEKIELTETEEKIFDRLLGTLRHFNLQTQLRVAGGWVRDKLLGKDCYDIDIALDNMLGSEFVDRVREYLLTVGEEAQGVAVIP